jgi:protoporphyrinogen oxidase
MALLGAGLTGLRAALECQTLGVDYQLFEREDEPGGLARTTTEAGYRFDRTGHLLHLRDAALKAEVLDWLGPDTRTIQRESRIWSSGVYTQYPFQSNTYGLPAKVAYECVLGFVKAQHRPRYAPPRNFEQYCRTHFGDAISEHFMIPYNCRLWGVAPSEITADWCQRFVPLPTLEDVLAGAVGHASRKLGYNPEFLYPSEGIGRLAQVLQRQLTCLRLGSSPTHIDLAKKRLVFSDRTVHYERLVSSIPLNTLLKLCTSLPIEVDRAARRLRCNHLYYLDLALNRPCGKDWHWIYVPEAKYPFYRVGCYSNFSERMAPKGCANLYVELAERAAVDLDSVLPAVMEGLIEMQLIRSVADLRFARMRHIDHAYVIFDHEHRAATTKVHEFLRQHDVISTGRYGEWTYSSMEDALLSGRRAVQTALQ